MSKGIRIGDTEYRNLKAFAKSHGQFLEYVANQAIRLYIETIKSQEDHEAKQDSRQAVA